ncbi:MAG: DUF167 domain-containing protein [Candidatus Woesearchaeota archaeon]
MIERLARALDEGPVVITVKPGKRASRISSYEPYTIDIAARTVEGAANRELLKYLKRTVGPCIITSGTTSRTKRIERVQ